MFCAKCGKEIDNDSTFCPFCGQKTDMPVENSNSMKKPKVSVRMPGKKVIGGIAAVVVVFLVVFGISIVIGGIRNSNQSLAEKLFTMSWEDINKLSEDDVKEMLGEAGTLYSMESNEGVSAIKTKTTESFMNGDSLYMHSPESFMTIYEVRYETEEEFKEGKKQIEDTLKQSMLKKTDVWEDVSDGAKMQFYLVDASDKYIDEYFETAGSSMLGVEWEEALNRRDQLDEEELDKVDELMNQLSIYKFVGVSFGTSDDFSNASADFVFPADKSYTNYMCRIFAIYKPMREVDLISMMAANAGYDAISGKKIDIEKFKRAVDEKLVNTYLDKYASDDAGYRRELKERVYIKLYMMENHKFDTDLRTYLKTDDEKRLWYVRNFEWDTNTDAKIDLSNYRDSTSIYCAVECNYNSSTAEYFESELDKALYLADRDYKLGSGENFGGTDEKRLWFMQNYSYDTSSDTVIDKEIVDALIAYDGYFNRVKDNMTGMAVRGMLAYLNDDNIPDCILFDDMQAASRNPADSTIYFLSYINGQMINKTIELGNCDFQYASKLGTICVGGYQGDYFDYDSDTEISYGGHNIIKLKDSFEDVVSTSWNQVHDFSSGELIEEEYEINGSRVGSMEEIEQFVQSFNCDVSVGAWDMTCLYNVNEGIKSSFLNLYDVLRTTTYDILAFEFTEFSLSEGAL